MLIVDFGMSLIDKGLEITMVGILGRGWKDCESSLEISDCFHEFVCRGECGISDVFVFETTVSPSCLDWVSFMW